MLNPDRPQFPRPSAALARIAEKKQIRVGYCDAAPWSFRDIAWTSPDAGRLTDGAKLVNALAVSLGAEARFIECRREELRAGLDSAALDIAIGGQPGSAMIGHVVCVPIGRLRKRNLGRANQHGPTIRAFPGAWWWLPLGDPAWRARVETFLLQRRLQSIDQRRHQVAS